MLMLSGCGGEKSVPPDNYTIGEDTLPAIQVQDENVSFSEDTDSETQLTSYLYQDEDSEAKEQLLTQYAEMLQEDYQCSVINEKGVVQSLPDFSDETGEALLGIDSATGTGLFILHIQWDLESFTITPEYNADLKVEDPFASAKTLEEILQIFENASPEKLNLSGDSMEDYSIYPEEGYIFINESPYIRVNVYSTTNHRYEKTFVISTDGAQVYELNRDTNQLTTIHL